MIQLARWKVVLVVLSLVIGLLLAFPSMLSQAQRDALPGWLPKHGLNLGLHLQGGSYLLLEVDVPEMRNKRVTNLMEDVRVALREQQVNIGAMQRETGGVVVTIADPGQFDTALTELRKLAQTGIAANGQPDRT